ncbi:YIP1 family protein [Halorubrum sp. Boch-26]|uniref:YIP1 family protein n=1 Tax=Halorubrum sp. Boch-26 TaxID=2994426 RepID=UPI002469A292|nr:YIP1 family protein [Halorubrum sp. Boch-26]
MTSWIENRAGGRARGPRGIARAWAEALVRPGRLFANGVSPGDQAPALTFAVAVAAAFALGWMVAAPSVVPGIVASVPVSALVVFLVVIALAAPVGLHLTAAVATVSVIVASVEIDDGLGLRDRGGVSETVQVVAYASSPMALAGPPIPALRIACGAYAAALLLIGFRVVHGTSWPRTFVAGAPPALLGYGVGYRVIASVRTLFA